MFWGIIIHH